MPVTEKDLRRFYYPGQRNRDLDDRKTRFAKLNEFVRERNGWITSIPGACDVTMECMPRSTLPDALRKLGYDVVQTGEGERIIPAAFTERLMQWDDGTLGPVTAGSSGRAVLVTHHAGIARVKGGSSSRRRSR